nr:2-dehydropantoate 2-reductase [Amylibacter sp.]
MEVLILGAGGIGGYLAARLSEAGIPPRLLVRPARAARLKANGLRLTSPLGDWSGTPVIETDAHNCPPTDIVIIACKSYDLNSALDAVAPAMGAKTILIPLLNGVRHMDQIKARFPDNIIWGGVAQIGVRVDPDDTICHFNASNHFLMGPLDQATPDPRVVDMVARLVTGPTQARICADIQQDLWEKLVFLATLAGMTCLMRASVGTILATEYGESLALQLYGECASVASAAGHPPGAAVQEKHRAALTDRSSNSTASMLRDILAGSQTEGAHILGDLATRAAAANLPVPLLQTCLTHLQAYEMDRQNT